MEEDNWKDNNVFNEIPEDSGFLNGVGNERQMMVVFAWTNSYSCIAAVILTGGSGAKM